MLLYNGFLTRKRYLFDCFTLGWRGYIYLTRMHSSRMHTARSSNHQPGVCLSACWIHPPRCGPGEPPKCGPGEPPPPGVGLENLPLARPPQLGLEIPPGQTPQAPPWVWAWKPARHAGIHTPPGDLQGMLGYQQGMLGYHPPPPPVN